MDEQERIIKDEIIKFGKRLYDARLVVAKAGNISVRLNQDIILITASGASLADLKYEDIVTLNLSADKTNEARSPSSELPLHSLIYKNYPAQAVIHCHPPLINGYFALYDSLKALTLETKFYLGDVPVIKQDTPTVTQPELVIEALKTNNLAVIKNHGVIAVGEKLLDALSLIEALEEAVKTAALARLFKKEILDDLDQAFKEDLKPQDEAYPMFSSAHIQAIVDLVNQDELFAKKGQELDLTLKLAIKLDETGQVHKFNFEKGKIIGIDQDSDAPYIISAPRAVWEQVFLGKLDSFVAVTQGKMKLQGQLGQLSKWYVPFTRLFELFKEIKFK